MVKRRIVFPIKYIWSLNLTGFLLLLRENRNHHWIIDNKTVKSYNKKTFTTKVNENNLFFVLKQMTIFMYSFIIHIKKGTQYPIC